MYAFQLQNLPEELSYGVLTKYQFNEEEEDKNQDNDFEEVMKNVEKELIYLNPKIKHLEDLKEKINEQKSNLEKIKDSAHKFLDEKEELLVLINKVVCGDDDDSRNNEQEEEGVEEDEDDDY